MDSQACPPDPRASQGLPAAVRGFVGGLLFRARSTEVAHVELGGRGLYEFYFAQGLLSRRHRPWLSVTAHDLPSLVGPPLLVRLLDRRGGRRVGLWLSATIGTRLERRLLRRADSVFALTETGAQDLAQRYGRRVHALPHVVDDPAVTPKPLQVFVPGYVDGADALVDLARVVRSASAGWTLVIGSCSPGTADEVAARLGAAGSDVRFLGHLDEPTLLRTFADSAVVVRIGGGHPGNAFAASGPLAWALARSCVCITDDRRAGAAELAAAGLVIRTDELAATLETVLRDCAPGPPHLEPELIDLIRTRFGVPAVAVAYWAAVDSDVATQLGVA